MTDISIYYGREELRRWRLSDCSDCLRDKWVETAVPAGTVLSQPVLPAATTAGRLEGREEELQLFQSPCKVGLKVSHSFHLHNCNGTQDTNSC